MSLILCFFVFEILNFENRFYFLPHIITHFQPNTSLLNSSLGNLEFNVSDNKPQWREVGADTWNFFNSGIIEDGSWVWFGYSFSAEVDAYYVLMANTDATSGLTTIATGGAKIIATIWRDEGSYPRRAIAQIIKATSTTIPVNWHNCFYYKLT